MGMLPGGDAMVYNILASLYLDVMISIHQYIKMGEGGGSAVTNIYSHTHYCVEKS
jgi:hypothetical protein